MIIARVLAERISKAQNEVFTVLLKPDQTKNSAGIQCWTSFFQVVESNTKPSFSQPTSKQIKKNEYAKPSQLYERWLKA